MPQETTREQAIALALLFKEEVVKAEREHSPAPSRASYAAGVELQLLDRLARRYCATQLTGMTQHSFLQLCGLTP